MDYGLRFILAVFLLGGIFGCDVAQRSNIRPILSSPIWQTGSIPLTKASPVRKTIDPAFLQSVSLSVTPDVSLCDLFLQLAKKVNLTLVVNVDLKGLGSSYVAQKESVLQIVQHLCVAHSLRYRLQEKILYIEANTPYFALYSVPFLLGNRKTESRVAVDSDLLASSQEGASVRDGGSSTRLLADSDTNFWHELEDNIKRLLTCGISKGQAGIYTLNKQAGVLSLFATQQQHECIESFLDQLKQTLTTQVMIEAKIIEVSLSEQLQSGINWNGVANHIAASLPLGRLIRPGPFVPPGSPERGALSVALFRGDLNFAARLMETFGKVRTLSNPRLTVLNNQTALLKAAKNEIFFRLEIQRSLSADGKPDLEHTTSRVQTVPIGLIMAVQPCVNLQTEEIILTLRPTVSRVVSRISDPSVAIQSNYRVDSYVPVVQVREMDSVLTLRSGEVMVMGGLMEDETSATREGLPWLKNIPWLSRLFSGQEQEGRRTELVMLLRATIIPPGGTSLTLEKAHPN